MCVCERERERGGESWFRKREINRFPSHVTGTIRKVYFCTGQVHVGFKRAEVVENTGT